ncbi:MAG: DegT/DnrJ/EryC1/StrS family aminotransferase [Parvibaculum sp.]|uniref:DegT/DnrJ/EryC1/StrS family aminotransferase n=1 Tax=Parvibaculum sp. TaxID=2024848 RepID=UPI002AB9C4E7|nr:DegT/DnrJ/EryC1/StrS family aminotransferase [Parvibaculum sp.]MDZ4381586.1 DegT/DnrJ/EryC1/StrS family aminotransferase [Parvibaculum sp.]
MIRAPELIPVAGPWITEREVEYVTDAARNAWFSNHYEYNRRFEEAFAAYVGVKHAVSLPHCTAAIHLSLAAAGIGAGDEVIVPDVTWIASVAPVVYVGATPIFADILKDTWCIDPRSVEAAVTPRTKAIIGVDLYGSMADWSELRRIADRHNLLLIEDAAEALGSEYGGRKAGSLGDTGVFSFHGSKTLTTGEGGMFVTNDDHLHQRVMTLRDHGRPPGDKLFLNTEIGFKYKMSALQAAFGLAQIERVEELIARKRDIFSWYKDALGGVEGLTLNAEPKGTLNSYWMVTAIPDPSFGMDKFALMAAFRERNIDTRPFFSPLSSLPAFAERPESSAHMPECPVGETIAKFGINLPSGYHMTKEKVRTVCAAMRDILSSTS